MKHWNRDSVVRALEQRQFANQRETRSLTIKMRNLKKPDFTAIGYHKHGKTEFYRDFLRHLEASEDQFEKAEGAPGMVMVVFTPPSYDVVFKLIKDRFAAALPFRCLTRCCCCRIRRSFSRIFECRFILVYTSVRK
jgi:isocitrate dehydrogenase kinase/phosphatase